MKSLTHVLAGTYRLTAALGFGATIMFIVFAPVLFGILPDAVEHGRHLSGQVVVRTLAVLQWYGILAGPILGALGWFLEDRRGRRVFRLVAGLLITLGSAISLFVIAAEMESLREAMGVIDFIAEDDPRRVAFNQLHHWSSAVHLVILGLLATLVAMRLPART